MSKAKSKHKTREKIDRNRFLPVCAADMRDLGWDQLDILIVSGDAYVDHPSFGAALIGRWLVDHGYRVGIISQPRWDCKDDFTVMGRPRLFAAVTAGSIDSMLAHYTAFRKKRSDDAYTPGGLAGKRPNRASIVYSSLLKQSFKGLPIVLGGVEASLRRISHYDFWTSKLRRSILLDAKASLLLYGMAESGILAAADIFERYGDDAPKHFREIPGCAYLGSRDDIPQIAECVEIASFEQMQAEPFELMKASRALEQQVHNQKTFLLQPAEGKELIITPPAAPLSTEQLDRLYSLPFTRCQHVDYAQDVPAVEMIRFSVTSHRGCGGGCSFCSLAAHQGRRIRSRSSESILAEVKSLTEDPDWRGSISDIGGPSANMWGARCTANAEKCTRESCMYPEICKFFNVDQSSIADLLDNVAELPGVKHLRVSSGVRFDLALRDSDYCRALVSRYVGGQLKLAPEHTSAPLLKLMRKPGNDVFENFLEIFDSESKKCGKDQFVVPYLMTAFPGCDQHDMRHLNQWLAKRNWRPQQVQCFIPLPSTVAAAMFYCGCDENGHKIHIPETDAERLRLHGMLMDSKRGKDKGKAGNRLKSDGQNRPGHKGRRNFKKSASKSSDKRFSGNRSRGRRNK